MALQGDATAMRLCVERMLPFSKESRIGLKIAHISTIAELGMELNRVLQAVGRGVITTEQGRRLADLLESRGRIIESQDLETRLQALERASGVNEKT